MYNIFVIRNTIYTALQNKNVIMFVTALVFMTGILCFFNDNSLLCAGVVTVMALIAILRSYVPVKYVFLWILIFYFGFFNSYFRIHSTDELVSYANSQKVTLYGQAVSIPNSNDKLKSRFMFKVNSIDGKTVSGKTLVTVNSDSGDFSQFQIGDFYEMKGSLRTPFKVGNPSQFDYGKYLRNFDVFTVFYTTDADSKIVEKKLSPKWKMLKNLNMFRDRIINVHGKYIKSPNLEILGGIIFGDDAIAPPDYIKMSFINSGLLHILAASGMNVAFIYGFWIFFMRRFRVPFKLSVISGMGLIILYTFMTGLGASVIRASLMLLFVLAGKLIDRDAHSISLLAFIAMLMLIYNPAYINNVSFQLSFIVTFGILTTANIIFERFKDSKIPNWLSGAILIPVVAQIWVAPIQMFYFNTFSTYSVFANVFSMPFLSVVSFGGFLSSILAIFTPFTDKICMCLDFVLNYFLSVIVFISNFFAELSHSLLTTTHPNILQISIYYVIILLATLSIKTSFSKKINITFLVCFVLLMVSMISISSKDLQVITFDVQNADCFLIKTPKNKYFIIDTGRAGYRGSKAQANSIIIKYLKDKGIKNIEGLIITHFDNDHSGGAVDIMKNLNVKKVYINEFGNKSMTSIDIYKTIRSEQISAEIPKDEIYREKDLTMKTFIANKNADNDKSIITLLSYKDFDMLFTGDAGVSALEQIKSGLPRNIEIFKVGHHGSFNVINSDLLDYMNTQVSIVSTGPNAYGHPTKGTLDILRHTEIYRTDRHNSIKITTDGKVYKIYTYNPLKHKYILSKSLFVL